MAEEPPMDVPEVKPQLSYEEAYRNRGESQCTVVWSEGQTHVVCFTCWTHPGGTICVSCFHHGNHEGHNYELQSNDEGCCDCGDPTYLKESGFCRPNPHHPRLCALVGEFEDGHLQSTHDGGERFVASSTKPSFAPSSTSCYYSARIQSMIENRSNFTSDVEFEIEYSEVHWTETDSTYKTAFERDVTPDSENSVEPTSTTTCESDLISDSENSGELNLTYFSELMEKNTSSFGLAGFFMEMDDIVVGQRIGKGGQAEIFEGGEGRVVKVFSPSFRLEDLVTQFPPAMLDTFVHISSRRWFSLIQGGILLKDSKFLNRFAIVMERQWGDLRKLIDQRKMAGNNEGPPFSVSQVRLLLFCIARDMHLMHSAQPPILHRDLKASNVLVLGLQRPSLNGKILATVADFESSVGVVGTGFWRAPEVLEQVKKRVLSSAMQFTEAGDVYSFGMLCYELVTGRLPFEGRSIWDYDFILDGNRPELPADLHPLLKRVVEESWHADPSKRPSFLDIIDKLNEF